jgi:hypothetical protein
MIHVRPLRGALTLALVAVAIAGCGQMPAPTPTVVPATSPAVPSGTATAATATPGALTLGELAARIAGAWPAVTSYQEVFSSQALAAPASPATPAATPEATPVARATPGATPVARTKETFVFSREVALPGRQRQQMSGTAQNDHEAIAVDGRLYIRGPLASQIAPGTAPDTWLEIDPRAVPANSVLSSLLGGLPQQPSPPLAVVPQRLWPQELRDLGSVEFDHRQCRIFGAVDTVPATGMRVDYSIAVDERNIPCFVETTAGGALQGRTEYRAIDGAFAITAPARATPVSVPAALATPVPRD